MGEHIALAIPYYNDIKAGALAAIDYACAPDTPHQIIRWYSGDARLTFNFNDCWCVALNMRPRPTKFVMMHVDVKPLSGGWLDMMVAEHARSGVDLLSVLLPIKTDEQKSSTFLEEKRTGRIRPLSMVECLSGPTTFDAADLGFPDCRMLFSTGLWICDFTKPWVEKVSFEVRDRIVPLEDGTFKAEQVEEAWTFSHKLYALGLKIKTTRLISAKHIGDWEYPNDSLDRGPGAEKWGESIGWWRQKG